MLKTDAVHVQYHGSHFTTQSCLDALSRLLASRVDIRQARLLSHEGRHGFYLEVEEPEPIFIRCGFTSGYGGEGPAGLAIALHMLQRFGVETEESDVSAKLLERLDAGSLTWKDLQLLETSRVIRPIRLHEYMHQGLSGRGHPTKAIRRQFTRVIPWSLLDERLVDLALQLESEPDKAVFAGFRRLESQVKARCGMPSNANGVKVFNNAFRGTGAHLIWPGITSTEIEGRAQLFEGAFRSIRNPRAHGEVGDELDRAYREFYLLNELFLLESEAELAENGSAENGSENISV